MPVNAAWFTGHSHQLHHHPVQLAHCSLTRGARCTVLSLPMNSEATPHSNQEKRAGTGGGPAFHSRLDPHIEFIRQQRRQHKTWRQIAEQLCSQKSCPITFQGVHGFYRRYLRRCARPHWEEDTPSPKTQVSARPETTAQRKPLLAATPVARPFRQPNPNNINLNDPSTL